METSTWAEAVEGNLSIIHKECKRVNNISGESKRDLMVKEIH